MLWGLRPVEQQAAYGLAVERLKRQIHMGFILPGERLPAERKLAEEVGLSRVTLREALRVLEAEGYMTTRRGAHGGAFVAESIILDDLAHKRLMLNPSQMMRVLEFREANELAAVKLACDRAALPEIKRMKSALATILTPESTAHLKGAMSQFTLAIGAASHNSFIEESIEQGLSQTFLPLSLLDDKTVQSQIQQSHQALLDAIEQKNVESAQQQTLTILKLTRQLARSVLTTV